jgi:23S rRNA (uracil1939-C5)-methyltransferase
MKPEQLLLQEKAAYPKVEPPCPYFGTCGGCALQDLAYQDQLALKRERLRLALAALGEVPPFDVIGLEEPWRYRNKAEFTFGESRGGLVLGYHEAKSFWRIVDLDDCLLLPEPAIRIMRDAKTLAEATGLPAYHPRTHQGFFRYLVVRQSHASGTVMVCLITTSGQGEREAVRGVIERMARELTARHPALMSVYWGVTQRVADVAQPEELILLDGSPHLEDRLGPFRVRLHPMSFVQPSSVQADRIYTSLADSIREFSGGIAWDLYCGLGLVGFYLARHFGKVYGIDIDPSHLELAALNASLNGISNIEFRAGKVEALLLNRRFWLQEAKPDLIVVDPPRAGLHQQALSSVIAARPKAIAYLSCNVQSLVRDLQVLGSSFPRYRLAQLRAYDMFPQTNHAELLAILHRA